MTPENTGDSSDARLLVDQRDANEKLVVATIRAEEDADSARVDTGAAEERASVLRASEVELLATAEFRDRMIGILGHDLRNPLNAISLGAEILAANTNRDGNERRVLERMLKASSRMNRMIAELLDFTQARLGGGFSLRVTPTDLSEVCRNVLDELRPTSTIEIVQSVEGDVTGLWDSDRLSEVVSNIVGNALGHATPNTKVSVRLRGDETNVVVAMTNRGPCIPAPLTDTIFLAFRRGDENLHRRQGHLGLGLYIAHEIVRSHGGTLTVRSADETTTFTMTLPRQPAI